MEIYRIAPRLYQSAALVDETWRVAGISVVVDLEGTFDNFEFGENEIYIYWHIHDQPQMPPPRFVRSMAHLVNTLRTKGHKVLVHCAGGWNRSSLVNARALIAGGKSPARAIEIIRRRRGQNALNNETFRKWLLREQSGT